MTNADVFCLCGSDIDECVTGTHSCSEAESCFNIQGGYKCLNFDCPPNYRRSGDTWVTKPTFKISLLSKHNTDDSQEHGGFYAVGNKNYPDFTLTLIFVLLWVSAPFSKLIYNSFF